MHITPKIADALRALAASPTQELTRCSGGYRPAGTPPTDSTRVTTRTVRAMDRAYLVTLAGPFASGATLTAKGREALAALQADAPQARAG